MEWKEVPTLKVDWFVLNIALKASVKYDICSNNFPHLKDSPISIERLK